MKLIVGLGNPGKQYENTRHNVGFMVLDRLREIANFPDFQMSEKFNSFIAEKKDDSGEKILLAKPMQFMNRSGEAVRALKDFYKVPLENITVIHDDLDINVGEYKISEDSSAAGHNGVQDIIDKIGTQKFKRIRIGIEGAEKRADRGEIPGDIFVLQKFTDEEIEMLPLTEDELKEMGIAGAIAFELKL
jgi:PTH1 family peptidyl-tRNA hydrolase